MDFIFDRNKTAIIYKEKTHSYKELLISLKYYSNLSRSKFQERVIIFMENRPEMLFSFYSVWENKSVNVVVDASSSSEQLLYIMKDSKPTHIFLSNETLETFNDAKKEYDEEIQAFNVDEIVIPDDFTPENMILKIDNREDIAVLLYTSGTTGNPKGVMLTYNNLLSNSDAVKEINIITETDRFLALLPFHHILPLNITLILPIYFGTFVVILDELNSEKLKKALKDNEITVIIGVPRVFELLHKGIITKINQSFVAKKLFRFCRKLNIFSLNKIVFGSVNRQLGGSLKLCVSGGARLDPEIALDLRTMGLPFIEGYGLTETSPLISFNRPSNVKVGSVGEPIPHVTVKVAEDGELLVKGPNIMKGYYNKSEETDLVINKEGWFHTGDLVTFENNFITIIGRKKEMIVLSNGKNINPIDIESEILRGSDLIKELVVTDNNDHLIAVVFPDFDIIKSRQITNIKETLKWQIIDQYNVTAPKYRKILEIKLVKDELPKTRLGKIKRFMLKDFIASHSLGNDSTEDSLVKEKIKKVEIIPDEVAYEYNILKNNIESNYKVEVFPDSHIELDLGLDSLDMMEILTFVDSNFGVKVNEEEFVNIKNILDLATFINKNGGKFSEKDVDLNAILNEEIDRPLPSYPLLGKIFLFLFWPMFNIYFSLKKIDKNKIPEEGALYVGNHQSFLDAIFLAMSMPLKKLKDTYFLAVNVHFNTKFRLFLARQCNIIIIDVNKNLKESLQMSAKVLKSSKNLVIFPEGARTRDGDFLEFKKTFAILSTQLNKPIVPFGLLGAFEAMPFGVKFPRPKKVTVKFFDKIEPEGYSVEDLAEYTKNTILEWYDKNRNLPKEN